MNKSVLQIVSLAGIAGITCEQVPTYSVEIIATFDTSTFLTGASEVGHAVGWQSDGLGTIRGFVANLDNGFTLLPLAPGHQSSAAMDVNSSGVVVGTSYDGTFPHDGGAPAYWTPDGNGSYIPGVPQQFNSLPSPLGQLTINGGQIVGINETGTMIGWSRYQGFQGGPTTQFFTDAPPINVQALGFQATVRDINNNNVIVGDGRRFDLNTNIITELGVPDPVSTVGFSSVIGYTINDSNMVVAAARRATSGNDIYLSYVHDEANGWRPIDSSDIPTRFVGFYDCNNQGDVAATGGILFAEENLLVQDINSLLRPEDSQWQVNLGFIDNHRRFITTAFNSTTNVNAIVMLVPIGEDCLADTNGDGMLTPADFSAWVAAFNAASPSCDQNEDGVCSPADFSTWVANYNAGC